MEATTTSRADLKVQGTYEGTGHVCKQGILVSSHGPLGQGFPVFYGNGVSKCDYMNIISERSESHLRYRSDMLV